MSAETLRRAAALMREVAQDANRCLSSRNCNEASHFWYHFGEMSERLDDDRGALYIASMPPVVALAVADWLDKIAGEGHEGDGPDGCADCDPALAVARAYLGESA